MQTYSSSILNFVELCLERRLSDRDGGRVSKISPRNLCVPARDTMRKKFKIESTGFVCLLYIYRRRLSECFRDL